MRSAPARSVVGLLACVICTVLGAVPRAAHDQVPAVAVPESAHDFGRIEQGSKIVHRFTVGNSGTAPLNVVRVSLSDRSMIARMKPSIPPGEEAALTIEWNTAGLAGRVEGRAVLDVDDPATPHLTFILSAVVVPAIEFQPHQSIYISLYQGEPVRPSVRIVNNGKRSFGISRLEQQGDHFRATVTPIEIGRQYQLEVTVPATVPPGRYAEAVFLYPDDPQMPRLMVPVNVLVKPEMYANPDVVDFGRVAVTDVTAKPSLLEALTQTVMVRKRAGKFAITRVTSDVPCVQARRSPDGSNQAFRIDVSLTKDRLRPGPIEGSIRILTDDRQFPELVVSVRGVLR